MTLYILFFRGRIDVHVNVDVDVHVDVDMDVDVDALTSCGIGRTVNKLKKAESDDVQTLAKALVKKWKDLVAAQEPFFICVLFVARSIRAGVMPARRRGGHRRALPSRGLTRAIPTAGPTRR